MTDKQRFSSVWDAIENTPQQSVGLQVRSELMMNLTEVIREQGMTQSEAAAKEHREFHRNGLELQKCPKMGCLK